MRLIDYYNDMNKEQQDKFLETAMIPHDVSLYIENFDDFYEKRKKLLAEKIHNLLR